MLRPIVLRPIVLRPIVLRPIVLRRMHRPPRERFGVDALVMIPTGTTVDVIHIDGITAVVHPRD